MRRAHAQVEQVITPGIRDLGGFEVRRALPSPLRRMVGPFIFLDRVGPATFPPGEGLDSRPHPHIGLQTLTYLLEGEFTHRDSEGHVQTIRPGSVNLMTAGRGIVHSERTSAAARARGGPVSGFQSWIALPDHLEETAPAFQTLGAEALPSLDGEGISLTLLAGALHGRKAPTHTRSGLFQADVAIADGARFRIDEHQAERAIYVIDGRVEVCGQDEVFDRDQVVAFRPGAQIVLRAHGLVRLLAFGGEPVGKRHLYWNFVSSRRERIAQAAEDWRLGRFPGVPGETEFTPLPDVPLPAV